MEHTCKVMVTLVVLEKYTSVEQLLGSHFFLVQEAFVLGTKYWVEASCASSVDLLFGFSFLLMYHVLSCRSDGCTVPLGHGKDTGVKNPSGYTLNYNGEHVDKNSSLTLARTSAILNMQYRFGLLSSIVPQITMFFVLVFAWKGCRTSDRLPISLFRKNSNYWYPHPILFSFLYYVNKVYLIGVIHYIPSFHSVINTTLLKGYL